LHAFDVPALCNDFSGRWQTELDAGAKDALFDVPSYLDGDTNIDTSIDTGRRPVDGAESSQIPVKNISCSAACGGAAQQCDHSAGVDHGLCAFSD